MIAATACGNCQEARRSVSDGKSCSVYGCGSLAAIAILGLGGQSIRSTSYSAHENERENPERFESSDCTDRQPSVHFQVPRVCTQRIFRSI